MQRRVFLLLALASAAGPASAQIAPTSAQIAQYSGLHAAAHSGDSAAITRLIAEGAALEARDAHGRTALHVATFAKKHAAMCVLAAAGANPRAQEKDRYDPITIAAVADDLETMKVAIAIGGNARDITSIYDGTALIAAAHLGHNEVVRELIRAGAPLDHINNLGWTALIEAVILGNGGPRHQDTVRALVEAKARKDIGDRAGVTPLMHAKSRGYAEIIKLLE